MGCYKSCGFPESLCPSKHLLFLAKDRIREERRTSCWRIKGASCGPVIGGSAMDALKANSMPESEFAKKGWGSADFFES
jgi:hypothetical protein